MSEYFNRSRLQLQVGSLPLPVLTLEGREALSEPFSFHIEILDDGPFGGTSAIGQPGVVRLSGRDGSTRELAGVVTAAQECGRHHDGRQRIKVELVSRLALLRHQRDQRLLLGQSVVEIARDLLQRHGFEARQIQFFLTRQYPARSTTLQTGETDLEFLQRLLADAGIFFWSGIEEGVEVVRFADHNCHCPALGLVPVRYLPKAGLDAPLTGLGAQGGIDRLQVRHRLVAEEFQVTDRNDQQPGVAIQGSARTANATGRGCQVHFGLGAADPEQARAHALLLAERAGLEAERLVAGSDLVQLSAGGTFSLDATQLSGTFSGEYLITSVRHRGSQKAGLGIAGADIAYSNEAVLIRRETPFRPPRLPRPQLPVTFTARIEASGPYAQLDEQGRYRLRPHFERDAKPHAEASIPIRRLSPYGGPPGESPTGWHLPLQDGAEVLLSCLNGDPDRPMIVGTLPNPRQASPVTAANAHQNRLVTAGDNELCLDDQLDQEAITLRTFGGHNILHLNAAALGHQVRLASAQGGMHWQAKKTMKVQSGDTLTEQIGGDRVQIAAQQHRTTTNSGEIHYQAATDLHQSASKNLEMQSGKNLEARSGKHLRIDVEQGKQVTIQGAQASFTVQDGNLQIQAAKEIQIRGQGGGDISVGQQGGGFIIRPDGSVHLYGNKVTLKGGRLSLNGAVRYEMGGGAAMPKIQAAVPIEPRGIPELKRAGDPAIINLAWSRKRVPVGETVEAVFLVKNFQGGETARLTIYECNGEMEQRAVDTLETQIDDGFGQHRIQWQRAPEKVREDLIHDREQGDPQALRYVFIVAIDDVRSEASEGLHLTTTITMTPQFSDGTLLEDGVDIVLRDAEGKDHIEKITQGSAQFSDVLVGPWSWQIPGESIELINGDLS